MKYQNEVIHFKKGDIILGIQRVREGDEEWEPSKKKKIYPHVKALFDQNADNLTSILGLSPKSVIWDYWL